MPKPSFPRSTREFASRFDTEEACFRYIIEARWPEDRGGFRCERCGHHGAWAYMGKWTLRCKNCRKVHSATAGTIMHRTRQPLCNWLWATYMMVKDKRGISSIQLQKELGIKRNETAFNMLHKLRAAMVNPDRVPLSGTVEVDEAYIGGPEPGKPGRGALSKALVVGAVEMRSDKPVRVRFRKIPSASAAHLMKFIKDNVATEKDGEKTVVITDGSPSYNGLYDAGYIHRTQSTGMFGDDPDAVLPNFHRVVSLLKRWLLGTHHGRVSQKHLQAYLNEYAFRFNRRGSIEAAFKSLLGLTSKVDGPTYEGLYKGTYQHKNPILTGYNI